MKIKLSREQELTCLVAAIEDYIREGYEPDHESRHQRDLSFYEFIAQTASAFCAEMAVAQATGVAYKPGDNRGKHRPDVEPNIEVKHSENSASGLWIQQSDRADWIGVLVTGKPPVMRLVGWIPIAMAKRPRYFNVKQNNWNVTQPNLQPMENYKRSQYGEVAI